MMFSSIENEERAISALERIANSLEYDSSKEFGCSYRLVNILENGLLLVKDAITDLNNE